MAKIKLFVSAAVLAVLIFVLNNGYGTLPAMGSLFSPFTGFWQNSVFFREKSPKIESQDLSDAVQVSFDERLVPHIFAKNTGDAYYVQGYLHAQHRLWQMEFITRAAAGRLAEVLGGSLKLPNGMTPVEYDSWRRHQGIIWAAEQALAVWQQDQETQALVEKYVAGVNAYIRQLKPHQYPLEYKILGVAPEAWSSLKTALFVKYMAMDLALAENDLQATNAKNLLGAAFDTVFPEYFAAQSPIVPTGTVFKTTKATDTPNTEGGALGFINYPDAHDFLQPDASNGSNNWAVAGSKTASGYPILCGDPHLGLRLPAIWYEIQITTPDMQVYGVSFPGIPSVPIGFNNDIAWTETNVGHDVGDWYKIQWQDRRKNAYLLDSQYVATQLRIETIYIKGGGVVTDTVRYTHWGPVVWENDTVPLNDMAFHWLGHEKPDANELKSFLMLNKARNYDEYSAALNYYSCPAQNFAFAAKNGDIALKVNGKFPLKEKGQGRFLRDGTARKNGWKGYIPRADIPQYKNPARGFVSSANQHSTDPSYPYYYNSENFEGYRGRLVNDFLSKMTKITVEDMKKLQNDNFSIMAKDALEALYKLMNEGQLSATEKEIWNSLKQWNYYYDADSQAAVYFEEWWKHLYNGIWDEILTHPNSRRLLKPQSWRTIELLQTQPNHPFFDDKSTPKVETAADIALASYKKMVAEWPETQANLKQKFPTASKLSWVHYKDTEIPHLSGIPGLGRKHLNNGGYGKAINAIKKDHGPSWRMIVALGEKPTAYVVYPGGQSGHPGDPHYADFVETWQNGEYYQANFWLNADEARQKSLVTQFFGR